MAMTRVCAAPAADPHRLGTFFAHRRCVRLTFDRGTVVVSNEDDHDLAGIPGVLWDARVGVHRALPFRCAALIADLRTRGVPVRDETASYVRAPDIALSGLTLRDYQEAALHAWSAAGRRGVVVLPTGSGKTAVAVGAIARARVSALCLVPTRVLLHQWRATLVAHYPGHVGVLGDGLHSIEAITVATFESAFRSMSGSGIASASSSPTRSTTSAAAFGTRRSRCVWRRLDSA
jgi:hypothetical protein